MAGVANLDEARQIATQGSLSGALIGGLLFGIGMVLAVDAAQADALTSLLSDAGETVQEEIERLRKPRHDV